MGRLIDNAILDATNELGIKQTKSTQNTLSSCAWLLDCVEIYPNPSARHKNKHDLRISSDSSYLSASQSISRVRGYHFLGNKKIQCAIRKPKCIYQCTNPRGSEHVAQHNGSSI